jgi:hypothetical protein
MGTIQFAYMEKLNNGAVFTAPLCEMLGGDSHLAPKSER